jgi:excisionase family DNA binding protein
MAMNKPEDKRQKSEVRPIQSVPPLAASNRIPNFEELLTRKEISQRMKLSERTIARWMREGNVPHHRYGNKVIRFRWSEVQRCFEERERDYQAQLDARRKAQG